MECVKMFECNETNNINEDVFNIPWHAETVHCDNCFSYEAGYIVENIGITLLALITLSPIFAHTPTFSKYCHLLAPTALTATGMLVAGLSLEDFSCPGLLGRSSSSESDLSSVSLIV
jgi:hypothetical protein